MGIYLIILLLFISLLFVFIEKMFQNFLIEFGINKTQLIIGRMYTLYNKI